MKQDELTSMLSFSFNIKLLQLFGTWPYTSTTINQSKHTKIKGYIYWQTFTIGFFFILYMITETITMVMVWGDLAAMAEASFLFLTHCAQIIKIYFMLFHSKRLYRLLQYLNTDTFQPKSERQKSVFDTYLTRVTFNTKLFMWMYMSGCTMYSIFPFLDQEGNKLQRKLAYRIWYPFDVQDSLIRYILIYLYQNISVTNNAVHNAAIDTIISGLMVHICAQLALLKDEIENFNIFINEFIILKARNKEEYSKKRIEFTTRCVQCILHHRKIKEFLIETESIFTFGILAQFAATILILCITALQLTIVEPFTFEFFAFITYLICMLSQTFLYCWYGNEILHHSLSLPDAIYQTNWYDSDKKYKQYVGFVIFHTQRPLKLRVGRFFTLSLNTFMAILRNSYSYFAVLNQMQNN